MVDARNINSTIAGWCESSAQRPCSFAQNEEYLHLLIVVVLQQRLDSLVEVALKHTHFALAVYLKLTLCLFYGFLMRHGTTAFQDVFTQSQYLVITHAISEWPSDGNVLL